MSAEQLRQALTNCCLNHHRGRNHQFGRTADPQARIPVEQQVPKCIQIEDDAESCRSFVARITSNSIDELGELASDLTSALQNLQQISQSRG